MISERSWRCSWRCSLLTFMSALTNPSGVRSLAVALMLGSSPVDIVRIVRTTLASAPLSRNSTANCGSRVRMTISRMSALSADRRIRALGQQKTGSQYVAAQIAAQC
ncbi:hypothetical protein BX661DRAFT_53015 [Kickxella alabastrina]|uniref:uncharacterized protein n=1 Tax=Kickxella alabastrina TaxID=61397 RepID=UPI00221EF6E9|nr:uncharacterized protein BX661DRAFT_53015 [Kickxella alabastrina]KAI7823950.1 hypothetical protein BX661DRAFT_53015 [Kickxella alabastrina]